MQVAHSHLLIGGRVKQGAIRCWDPDFPFSLTIASERPTRPLADRLQGPTGRLPLGINGNLGESSAYLECVRGERLDKPSIGERHKR